MIEHSIENNSDIVLVTLFDHLFEIIDGSKAWIYIHIIYGIVLMIRVCPENGIDIDTVHTQICDIIQVFRNARYGTAKYGSVLTVSLMYGF